MAGLGEWSGVDAMLREKVNGALIGILFFAENQFFAFLVGFAGLNGGEIVDYGYYFFKFGCRDILIFKFDNFGNVFCISVFFDAGVGMLFFLFVGEAEIGS